MSKSDKKKILVIRLGAIGDVVQTTVIPKSIKLKHPDYEVHYLTQSDVAPVLSNHPYIDKVICLNAGKKRDNKYLFEVGYELYKEHYDVVINLTNALRNFMLALIAMPKRIFFKQSKQGLWVEDYFYSAKTAIKDIELPESIELGVDVDAGAKIDEFLKDYPPPYIMIVPAGANDKNRQGRIWSIENWKNLSKEIVSKYGGTVFVCGSKWERQFHNVLEQEGVVLCSGKFKLAETCALLSKSNLVISGDTGPMHIATGYDVNVLALLGSTSPDKIKPYGKKGYYVSSDKDCKYCWKKKCKLLKEGEKYTPCMKEITLQKVLDSIELNHLL